MNKFKAFFGQPLISSSTKIVPLKESSPDSARKGKPPELITLKKIDTPAPILNKKPEKSKTITPNQRPVKKNRMSLRFVSGPSPISFDFEQYDDVVDAQLMKKRQIAKIENKPVSPESPASPASPNGRRHTWAVPENRDARFKAEFIRIPVNADSRHSLQVKPKVEALAPPPVVVSKVISESEITDSSDSSNNVTDSIRKDLGENGIEFLDDFKKGPAEKPGFEPSDFFASHDRLKVDNEENKEEKEENEEEDLPNLDEFKLSRSRPRHLSDSPVKIKDFMTEEERERQREIFLKVSLQQANDIRKAQNEKINENLSAVGSSSSSSDSDVDSLIENNPFEDEKSYQLKKKATFRRMQTRLREDERYSKLRYILFPDDRWRKFWDIIIVIALLYTALVMPIRIAFLTDDGGDESTGSTLWPIVEYLIDSIFLGDIILTFFSAYFDRDDSLVVSKKKIAWHYLTGWFFLDLVSILPFQLFMSNDQTSGDPRLNNLVRIARLPRLYRLVKIIQLARMVKIIRNRSQFLKYMNTTLKLGPAYERLLVSVIGILLFCHIASCIWYMLVGLSDPETGWLGTFMITYLPTFDQYIACFYLVVQTVTTVGYGDMPPQNPGERLLTVFLMIFGVLCYSIFIGFLSSLINDTEVLNQIYNHKLNILHRLTKEYALPVFFQKKLKTAIKFQNKQTMDSKHFIGDLPTGLAVDLACIMHRDIVESIPFLQNRPKGFIASLCPTLKPITVHKNDPVFSEGDPADEIFFIKSGTIGLVLPKYKNECFLKVREGYFFGEIDLLFYGEIRKYTAIALKDCELYVLNKKDFKHVFLSEHRDIGASLYDNAYMRKQRTRKAFKEAVEICKGFQNQKHRKIRLSIITKANPLDFEPESSESDKGLGIVEEEEEEEEEHHKEKKPDGCGVPVSETKPLNPLLNLKVALALSRGLNGQRQSVMAAIGSPAKRASVMGVLGSPKTEVENKFAGLKARRSIFGSLLPPPKEENNVQFSDLNKKLDSLEAKMAKLAALGESMRARTSRDSMTMRDSMRDSVGTPGLPKSDRKSLLSRVLALTPSNQPRTLPTDLKVPMDLSVGGASPTNSDTSWGGLRSPNALKRQLIKKDGIPFQSSIPPIKRLSSPQNSQFDMESDRITPTPTGDLLMNKGAFVEFRAANESLTVRGDSFKDSINLDQSSREVDVEAKEGKEDKEEEKLSQEEKPEKVEKVAGKVERKSAFRDQLRIGLKKITEREEDDAKNEKAKAHNFLFIQERRGSYKNPDKLDRKATMGETKGSNQNVEVEEF